MKRYRMSSGQYGPGAYEVEDDDGEWVRYEDAKELLDREQAMKDALDEVASTWDDEDVIVTARVKRIAARKLEERRRASR